MRTRSAFAIIVCASLVLGLLTGTAVALPRTPPEIENIALQVGEARLKPTASLVHGQTLVPLRALCEALGYKVTWDGASNTATVGDGPTVLSISTGSQWADLNGHRVLMNSSPQIQDGAMIVSLRFLAEALDYSIRWDRVNRAFGLKKIVANPGLTIATVTDSAKTKNLSLTIQYPQVKWRAEAVQKSINRIFSEHAAVVKTDALKYEKEAMASPRPYMVDVMSNYKITYNQKGFLSVLIEDYFYTGGAHGMTKRSTVNVSLYDGKMYQLKDLFAPGTDYVALLSTEIKRQMPVRDLVMLTPFEAIKADQAVYLKDDGIVLYWAPYEYTPYAWGFVEFTIPPFLYRALLSQDFQGVF
jgi:hypothetical protein